MAYSYVVQCRPKQVTIYAVKSFAQIEIDLKASVTGQSGNGISMIVNFESLCMNQLLNLCNMVSDSSDCIKSAALRHVAQSLCKICC